MTGADQSMAVPVPFQMVFEKCVMLYELALKLASSHKKMFPKMLIKTQMQSKTISNIVATSKNF